MQVTGEKCKFYFNESCLKAFSELKEKFVSTPIIISLNWCKPFEVMCDASDFAIGVVLGQREDGKPYVIYHVSKTLNEA